MLFYFIFFSFLNQKDQIKMNLNLHQQANLTKKNLETKILTDLKMRKKDQQLFLKIKSEMIECSQQM